MSAPLDGVLGSFSFSNDALSVLSLAQQGGGSQELQAAGNRKALMQASGAVSFGRGCSFSARGSRQAFSLLVREHFLWDASAMGWGL